jgi:murein DD-endopeptidase MepM/ murein hydrolase activator NlpD
VSKKITFIVMSDRHGVTRRLVLSVSWLKTLITCGIVGFIILACILVDYVGLLLQEIETKKLKVENRQLKAQFSVVESKLEALDSSLERVQSFMTKLRMITDTNDNNRVLKLTVGPLGQTQNNLAETRAPAEERGPVAVSADDTTLTVLKKPILDSSKGELARSDTDKYLSLSVRIDRAIKKSEMKEQGVLDLWETLSMQQSLMRATPSIRPARGLITSDFGYRPSPISGALKLHQGIDFGAPPGAPVYATADGVVSYAAFDSDYGKLVSIDHGYGVVTRYAHNSELFVVVGQKIKRGDVIAAVGNTGRSTGTHLHYEVRVNGVPVDPLNYILE